MVYRDVELDLINRLYDSGCNREEIAVECNKNYYDGRPVRTAKGIEFVLLEKLKRKNDRFHHICEICNKPFRSGWSNARYCSEECHKVVEREYTNGVYKADLKKNIQQQTIRARARIARRWKIILDTKGDRCIKCKKTYPPVVYDLHHPNGKKSRKDSPSQIIRGGSEEHFNQMLQEVEIWCPICHRLHHAETGDWGPMRKGQ